ncbi:MAG TPA: hypothetical protein VFV84_09190 [Burkholderiales bacterium]|nr:hypothetical protein [Burkholderiales bacterium]
MPQLLISVVLVVAMQAVSHWTFPSSIEAHSIVTVPFHADEMD